MAADGCEPLRRSAPVTMHQQLSDLLRAQLARLPAGGRFPTEQELAAEHQVSRTTVRRAVQSLVDEGLLIRHQGKGTFAAPTRIVHPLDQLRPFVSIFTGVGKRPEGTVLSYEWLAHPELPTAVQPPPSGALLVRRLYTLGGIPQALAEIYVPGPFGQHISRSEIEAHPIYQVLQDRLELTLDHATVALHSRQASDEIAGHLEVAPGSALLVMQRATYDDQQRLVECAIYHLPSDKFELRLTVRAQHPETLSYSFTEPRAHLVLINGEQA